MSSERTCYGYAASHVILLPLFCHAKIIRDAFTFAMPIISLMPLRRRVIAVSIFATRLRCFRGYYAAFSRYFDIFAIATPALFSSSCLR